MNIDDATVEMGALGANQIPYPELTQRQKVVRDLSVKRMRERERAGSRGKGWPSRGKGGGKGVYEHPHARGRGRGERRGNMELCPESERRYLVELEETLREQETQSRGSGGAEQAQSVALGDEDGQDDRVEQEKTDAQANPGADIEMSTQAAAARVELAEASGTPLPGGAGGGGESESDGGEPDPKRRQTMEEVEDEVSLDAEPRVIAHDMLSSAARAGGRNALSYI